MTPPELIQAQVAEECRLCRPAPVSDPQRLRLLVSTGLLDAQPEPVFERLTQLTADLTGAAVALLSLVDDRRQFFLSEVGLAQPWAERRETPLSHSFCQQVVTTGQPLIVVDSEKDARVKDCLAVRDLGVLAYAGYPIVASGEVLGSFCAIRGEAHHWQPLELRVIREFAETVSNEIELRLELEARKEAQRALEVSNRELEQFAQMAAHDLREPLRGVRGCLEVVREQLGETSDRVAVLLNQAITSASHMDELVQSLHRYSRLSSEPLTPTAVDLDIVLEAVRRDMLEIVSESGATLVVEGPLGCVQGESARLRQLFQNLISNALKFSKPGQPSRVVVSREDGVYCVRDNGIGIAAKYHQRVFEVFRRLHSRTEVPGTGIGLAICKRVVELCGGRIWVESQVDVGSRFYFTLDDKAA